MDDGPDYNDVGWFRDSPSEIWGKEPVDGFGLIDAIVRIILLPVYIAQGIVWLPFVIIYGIFKLIFGIFDPGSNEEIKKKKPQSEYNPPPTNFVQPAPETNFAEEEKKRELQKQLEEQQREIREMQRKEFFSNLEDDLEKGMSESPYWQNCSADKRERQISRFLKEAKLDYEKLGREQASKLWFGFIKRNDAEREARQLHQTALSQH